MSRSANCTPQMRQIIVHMYCKKKQSIRQLADELGVGRTMVWSALKHYRETGSVSNPVRKLRPRKTTQQEDRMIVRTSKKNPFLTANEILDQLQPDMSTTISDSTVRRRLREANLRGCVAKSKPLVSKKNIKARLLFAKQHKDKPLEFWQNVLWSDESKFNLFGSDGKQYVRRPKNKEFDPRYTLKTVKHGGGNVMVWGAFSSIGVGPIVRIRGIMDQHQYKNILANDMLTYAHEHMSDSFVFQHDNDPKHTSRLVKGFLRESDVNVLDWPAQSPDLNPIENLWGHVQQQLKGRNGGSADKVYANIEDIWKNIPLDYMQRLINSMPQRCREVIANKGYPTRY